MSSGLSWVRRRKEEFFFLYRSVILRFEVSAVSSSILEEKVCEGRSVKIIVFSKEVTPTLTESVRGSVCDPNSRFLAQKED